MKVLILYFKQSKSKYSEFKRRELMRTREEETQVKTEL